MYQNETKPARLKAREKVLVYYSSMGSSIKPLVSIKGEATVRGSEWSVYIRCLVKSLVSILIKGEATVLKSEWSVTMKCNIISLVSTLMQGEATAPKSEWSVCMECNIKSLASSW